MPQVTVPGRIAQKLIWYYLPAYTAPEAARISGLSPCALRRRVAGFLSFADLLKALAAAELAHCVEVDQYGLPIRLYPPYPGRDSRRIVAVDPRIAFGRPIVLRTGVSTRAIYARIRDGESFQDVAEDYGLTAKEIRHALLFEQGTRPLPRQTRSAAASARRAQRDS